MNVEMSTEFLWGICFKTATWKTETELEENINTFFLRSDWDNSKSFGDSALDCPLYQPRIEDKRHAALLE
jgi:hypothetical protein